VNISPHGFWLFVDEQELFVSFKDFPWFSDASIREIAALSCRVHITCIGRTC